MLNIAFALLASALLSGGVAAALRLHRRGPAPWPAAGLHGLLALAGLGALLLALREASPDLRASTASFGTVTAALLALAVLIGAAMLAMRLMRRRVPGVLIGVHATLAVSGFVVLAAYIFAG